MLFRFLVMAEGVDGGSCAPHPPASEPLLLFRDTPAIAVNSTEDDVDYRTDLWGYPVHTRSDACISFINDFYRQVRACIPSSSRL